MTGTDERCLLELFGLKITSMILIAFLGSNEKLCRVHCIHNKNRTFAFEKDNLKVL